MFLDRIDRIETIQSAAELWQETLSALSDAGLDFAIYLTVNRHGHDPRLMTNIGALYDLSSPESDPFLHHCCNSYDITRTGAAFMDEHPYLNSKARSFILAARDRGFTAGMALPMRLTGSERYGGFNLGTSLSGDAFRDRIWPQRESIRFFCLIVHRRMEELAATPSGAQEFRKLLIAPDSAPLTQLSPREKEMIYLLARGLSRKECAQMCGISPNTANEYVKSAYRKLGVRNRVEATRLVHNGEI